MKELFWNYLWMVLSLHDIVVNAVPHVVSALYHAEYLIIKEYCVFVCGTEDNMMGESRQSVLIQDIAKSGVDKGQTVVYYTYLLSQKIYGGITNSIPNVKEPLSKERISCPHVGGEAKGVGMKEWPYRAHSKASGNLMGIGTTQHDGQCLAPVSTQDYCLASKGPRVLAHFLKESVHQLKGEAV